MLAESTCHSPLSSHHSVHEPCDNTQPTRAHRERDGTLIHSMCCVCVVCVTCMCVCVCVCVPQTQRITSPPPKAQLFHKTPDTHTMTTSVFVPSEVTRTLNCNLASLVSLWLKRGGS